MTETFLEKAKENNGGVVILAGSDSDRTHIARLVKEVRKYGIPIVARIASAHKQPDTLAEIVQKYDGQTDVPLVYIAVAGGVDTLSGTVSFQSYRPVISCPPEGSQTLPRINQSCLENPTGSSNACVMLPANAARFVAQIFANYDGRVRAAIRKESRDKVGRLEQADAKFVNHDWSAEPDGPTEKK